MTLVNLARRRDAIRLQILPPKAAGAARIAFWKAIDTAWRLAAAEHELERVKARLAMFEGGRAMARPLLEEIDAMRGRRQGQK